MCDRLRNHDGSGQEMTRTGTRYAQPLRWACWLGILVLALATWLHAPAAAEAQAGNAPRLEHSVALLGDSDALHGIGPCAAATCLFCVAVEGESLPFRPAIPPTPPILSVQLLENRTCRPGADLRSQGKARRVRAPLPHLPRPWSGSSTMTRFHSAPLLTVVATLPVGDGPNGVVHRPLRPIKMSAGPSERKANGPRFGGFFQSWRQEVP